MVWNGLARYGTVGMGEFWYGEVWQGFINHTRFGATVCGMARFGWVRFGRVRILNHTRLVLVGHCVMRQGMERRCEQRRGEVWYGKARYGF